VTTSDPLLMTPGPTRIPARVMHAGNRNLHHRSPEFSALLAEAIERLRPLFGADSADILPVHGTGRAAMEGAILNFFEPGDTILACCNGKFGAMWAGFASLHGLNVIRIGTDWDHGIDPAVVARAIQMHPEARAVTLVHADTSTGVLNPVGEIAAVARDRGLLVLIDGISSVGGCRFEFDAWGLDFAVTGSQKCLMSSPGLAFAVVGERAWSARERVGARTAYLDFGAIRESLAAKRPETPGTTPVSLVLEVLEALRMIDEEGPETVFERHERMAAEVRARASRLGFTLQGPGIVVRSPTLTALRVPAGVDPGSLRREVLRRGIRIAAGLGPFEASVIRIGHMGDIRMEDVHRTMGAVGEAMTNTTCA
jgi:aspartate aminotransferase-like enzyme